MKNGDLNMNAQLFAGDEAGLKNDLYLDYLVDRSEAYVRHQNLYKILKESDKDLELDNLSSQSHSLNSQEDDLQEMEDALTFFLEECVLQVQTAYMAGFQEGARLQSQMVNHS